MLVGYMRVIKADGCQVLDLQRDVLQGAGVGTEPLHEGHASGKRDDLSGLEVCLTTVCPADTLVAWKLDQFGRTLRHSARIKARRRPMVQSSGHASRQTRSSRDTGRLIGTTDSGREDRRAQPYHACSNDT